MKSFALSFLMVTASAVRFVDGSDRIVMGEAAADLPWDTVNKSIGKMVDEDEYNKGQPKGYEVKAQKSLPWDTANPKFGKVVDEDEYKSGAPKGYEVKAQQDLPWDTVNKSIGKMVDEDEYNKGQPKGYEVKAQLPEAPQSEE